MHWLGLDIGGANVKAANGHDYAASQAFALWQRPDELPQMLRQIIAEAPPCDQLAITMTGELADCFRTKNEGVQRILDAVEEAAQGRPTHVYLTRGIFVCVPEARQQVAKVAAANWHALARFSARFASAGTALHLDAGSTSCDVIPLCDGRPSATGTNDTERLLSGELVYSGVKRTPLCGLVSHIPWRDTPCPVAREWFATTRDIYTLTGDLPEDASDVDTADGKPATMDAARTRLARMFCADADALPLGDAQVTAAAVATMHADQIANAIRQVVATTGSTPTVVIVSGEGEFLAHGALKHARLDAARVISLNEELSERISQCAPAHAIAVLAAEVAGG